MIIRQKFMQVDGCTCTAVSKHERSMLSSGLGKYMLWLYARQPGRVLKKLNAIRKRDCSDILENDFLTAGHLVFFKTPPGC